MTGINGVTASRAMHLDEAPPKSFSAPPDAVKRRQDGDSYKFRNIELHTPKIRDDIRRKLPSGLADTPIKVSDYKDPKNGSYKNDYATVHIRNGHVSVDVTKAGIEFLNKSGKKPGGLGITFYKRENGKLGANPPVDTSDQAI